MTDEEFLAAAARGDTTTVKAALDDGVSADTQDAYGNTALMMACARGQRDVCRALLEAGANPGHKNKYGMGPRNWADWAEEGAPIRAMLS